MDSSPHSKRYCFFTNDVETTSLWNHRLSDKTGEKVLKEGMPVLLELYLKYEVRATFFFTGYIAEKFPEVVRMVLPYGHEVGCHGMYHDAGQAFDVLNYQQQVAHLQRAKGILEDLTGQGIISFRAPALRVNRFTPMALLQTGFRIDSSVAPQRMDFFLSFGSREKIKWLVAPRMPYFTDRYNLAKKGNSPLLEIQTSALLIPYAGTLMRISPSLTKLLRSILHLENRIFHHPVHFIIHPNELIEEEIEVGTIARRAKSFLGYLFGDLIRYKLKLNNLGGPAIGLFEKQLQYFHQRGYKAVSLREFCANVIDGHVSGKPLHETNLQHID